MERNSIDADRLPSPTDLEPDASGVDPSEGNGLDLEESKTGACEACGKTACRCRKDPNSYAHKGRRRKRITEELFRCKLDLLIVREAQYPREAIYGNAVAIQRNSFQKHNQSKAIKCNALVWRSEQAMRDHMREHLRAEEILSLTDNEIRAKYQDATRIAQEGIPDNDEE